MSLTRTRCIVLLATLAGCGAPQFAVTPRYGPLDIDGEFGVTTSGVNAVNDVSDLGLEKDDSVLSGTFDAKWGSPHLFVSLMKSEHDGDGTLSAEISQGSTTIPAGTGVSSEFELSIVEALLTFDLLPTDLWELGIGFGVLGLDLDWSVQAPAIGESIDTQEFAPIPVAAIRAGVGLGPFEVDAIVSGINASVEDAEADVLDLDVQARWFFSRDFIVGALAVGYRRLDLDVEYEDGNDNVVSDLVLDGPYVGLVIGF